MRKYFIIIIILFLALPAQLEAQRKRKHTEGKAQREAEFYFTEGQKFYILEDYAKALVMFEQARELVDDNAAIYYKIAQIYENQDDLNKAWENISQAINIDKTNKYYFLLAAGIQTRLGNFDRAAELYEEMISGIENTQNYLLELAAIYMYESELEKALEAYNRAEAYYGVNEDIISQKQKILIDLNDLEGAIHEGQKLINFDPENEFNVVAQAELLVQNNRKDEALALLVAHVEEYPQNSLVNMFIGNIYLEDQNLNDAEPYLLEAFGSPLIDVNAKVQILATFRADLASEEKQLLALDLARQLVAAHSDIADVYSVYGDILFTLGNKKEARKQYLHAINLNGSNFTLWQNVLQLYLEDFKYDSLLILSEEALELFPNQNAIYYYRGLANLKKRNYQEAIADLHQGKMLSISDPKLVSAFNGMLGEAYHGLGQYERSDEAFQNALDYDPDNPLVLNSYSYLLALRKDHLDRARELAERLVEQNPEVASYIDTYAWVLYQQKEYKLAKKTLTPIIENDEASGAHHDHYGDILFKLGEKDTALKHWKIAREKDPSIKNIEKKIADQQLYE